MYSYFRSLQFKITLAFAVMVLIILWLGISVLALTNTIPALHHQSDSWQKWLSWSAISAMTAGVLVALYFARHLIKVVCGGLNRQTGKFSEMATLMDFSKRSASPRKDEFGKSAKAFDGFLHSIESAVTTVIHATASVTMATREIAQGNMDLSRRTEEQATALEQTAHSMQRLTDAIRHTTDNAVQANQRANEANALAQSGSASMQKMNDTITRLEQSSKQISEITTLIDGIAFQTNILALNAAVEAARAGEQGRGFAVVASEVRHLASRSSSAAKDIRNLIDDSVGMVHSSLQQAHDVGNTVRQVQQAIASVSEIVDAISTGSQDQRQRAEHIDTTIAQMDQSTQQNAALVEQVAAAAHSLEEQSERLTHAVSAFRVSQVQAPQPPLHLPLQQTTIRLPAHA